MRKPKFIRRILDRFIDFKFDLPKTTPPKRKFPILKLPFVAQKQVLWMLELKDLIPISFLSKRSKQMIKQALPSKIAQYECTVCSNEVLTIRITSRFGSYTGSEPNLDHIIELLSYPPIQVFVYCGSAITKAAEWMETHQHCVKKVSFSVPPRNRGLSSEFINPFTELNTQSELVVCSKEEILIDNPDISLMQYIWGLECRRLRLTSERPSIIFLANFILFDWIFGENYESSIIEQLLFELREHEEVEWKPENPGEKREEEWEHPIIPISFLSKRCKRMIKQALPSKKAQYDCTVLSREVPTIKITSRFGSYTGCEPNLDHIIEVLSYPPIGVVIDVESAMTKAARWIKTHHHCVKEVLFSPPPLHPGMSTKFVNPRFELNTQLDGDMVTVCSQDEIRIENPDISLMYYIWGLKCRRLRLTSERSSIIFLANFILFDWIFGENYESSIIEQLIFELRESGEIEWRPENPGERREDEWKHPIYGKINVWYRLRGFKETKEAILFKTHHGGKHLMVLNIQRIFGVLDR